MIKRKKLSIIAGEGWHFVLAKAIAYNIKVSPMSELRWNATLGSWGKIDGRGVLVSHGFHGNKATVSDNLQPVQHNPDTADRHSY